MWRWMVADVGEEIEEIEIMPQRFPVVVPAESPIEIEIPDLVPA